MAGELAAAICAEAFAQLNPTSQQQPDDCLSGHEEGKGPKKKKKFPAGFLFSFVRRTDRNVGASYLKAVSVKHNDLDDDWL